MTKRKMQWAVKDDGSRVWIADVERGAKGLTCYTCGGNVVVKDGRGEFIAGTGGRNRAKGKHFAHAGKSKCHSEGPAHYRLKRALCDSINAALSMPPETRNCHGRLNYVCPDDEYGPHDSFKFAPSAASSLDNANPQFTKMQHGYHHFDLLRRLNRAETEVSLGDGATRADIAGTDVDGNVLWAIEIKRTSLRRAAVKNAKLAGYPLFVIDISKLPKPADDDPMAEVRAWDYVIIDENLVRGFYPAAVESYNTTCRRREFGMGPTDTYWSKMNVLVCRADTDCGGHGCPECEEALLHECGGGDKDEPLCPDTAYMFEHGINPAKMYTDPRHHAHSHLPPVRV